MHKRTGLLLSFVLLLLLCGCGAGEPLVLSPFSCDVQFESLDTRYRGKLQYASTEQIRLTLETPKALRGLTFDCKEGELTASLAGLPIDTAALEHLPLPQLLPQTLFSLLRALGKTELHPDKNGTLTGALLDVTYEARFDTQSHALLTLKSDDCSFVFFAPEEKTRID